MTGGTSILAARAALIGAGQAVHATDRREIFPIVELRQYTLHDGQRDKLITLFEREFVESQEALGLKVIGTFRDLDRPDRFVWLRGFHDMHSRLAALTAFYGGPTWQAHRDAANATMIDSENVLLLHAPKIAAQFDLPASRPAVGERRPGGIVVAVIDYLKVAPGEAAASFASRVKPALDKAGIALLAWFVPETVPNNFTRLPVREGEQVLVWFARFDSIADYAARKSPFVAAAQPLAPLVSRPPEVLKLAPTARSLIR